MCELEAATHASNAQIVLAKLILAGGAKSYLHDSPLGSGSVFIPLYRKHRDWCSIPLFLLGMHGCSFTVHQVERKRHVHTISICKHYHIQYCLVDMCPYNSSTL